MAVYNAGGGGGTPFVISNTAPTNKTVIWIDSGNSYIAKVYNGSSWIALGAVWK